MINEITETYVIEWDITADYSCRDCARQWAEDNGLEWHNPNSLNYTLENSNGLAAYCDHFGQLESDYPQACQCGRYLDVRLTPDGMNYLRDNNFPEYVNEYYGVEKGDKE